VQVTAVHPVVRVDDHRGRMDVLGTALRLIDDVRAGRAAVPGLQAEELAGLDRADAGDAVAYVQGLLAEADGELVARMLEQSHPRSAAPWPKEPGQPRNEGPWGKGGGRR
jgi:hypothetical protein